MKYVKHFINVINHKVKTIFCKHESTRVSSCPFTARTYVTCNDCWTRIEEKPYEW